MPRYHCLTWMVRSSGPAKEGLHSRGGRWHLGVQINGFFTNCYRQKCPIISTVSAKNRHEYISSQLPLSMGGLITVFPPDFKTPWGGESYIVPSSEHGHRPAHPYTCAAHIHFLSLKEGGMEAFMDINE